jgi:hypothetical protein
MVPVPVPTFESYGSGSGSSSIFRPLKPNKKNNFGNNFVFLLSKLF